MSSAAKTVMLTGASGVIGRAVVDELSGHTVVALAHSDVDTPPADEVHRIDLARPRLGLSEGAWHGLAERVDVVIHSAALTAWGQPRERYRAINIDGTRRVVEFAHAAGAPVYLISTCFVHAIERGKLSDLRPGNVVAPYIWSKLEAERVLVESGVPYSIFRPTNVVGDSRTGASSRPQVVQQMSDWLCRGKAPFFPAHAGNLVDLIPLDVTAAAVARAMEAADLGRIFWLTYGPDAMTVEQAQQIILEHARGLGREIEAIPIVDPRLPLPVPLERIPATSRVFVQVLIDVSEVTHACGGILPSSLAELRGRLNIPTASDRDAYRRSLSYWAGERSERRYDSEETA
jgi:nucleoside-diphosphate-sugar epimerase